MILAAVVLLFFIIASALWSADRAATIQASLVFSLTVTTWAAVAIAVAGAVPRAFLALTVGTSAMAVIALSADTDIDGRAVLNANVNDVAALFVIVSAYIVSEFLRRGTSGLKRAVQIGLFILHLSALLATGSRTGILAVSVSVGVILAIQLFKGNLRASIGVLLLIVTMVLVVPRLGLTLPERILAIPAALDAGELSNREYYWALAADEIPSVGGIGFGAVPTWMAERIGDASVIHSVYIGIALELGLIGALLWLRFVWLTLESASRSTAAVSLLAAAAGMAIMASTLTLETRRPLWVLFALMAADGILKSKSKLKENSG